MQEKPPSRSFCHVHSGAIEEIRIVAALLLVAYHVVGMPDSGLRIQYPHGLRFFADLLASFRMPAFAFVAGFVYCMRPPDIRTFDRFVVGKLRRLAVPGIVAAAIFALVANIMGLRHAVPLESIWQIIFFPYVHYWFLQAILVIFVVVGLADAATGRRGEAVLLAVALPLALSGIHGPLFFSIDRAIPLAPCFIFGMCVYRHAQWIDRHSKAVTLVSVVILSTTFAATLIGHLAEPLAPPAPSMAQYLAFGMSACMLMLLHMRHSPNARTFGQFTFTIYLYHVFAAAGMRMFMQQLGIVSIGLHLAIGVAAGVLFPILLHQIAARSPITAMLFLGIRRQPERKTVAVPARAVAEAVTWQEKRAIPSGIARS